MESGLEAFITQQFLGKVITVNCGDDMVFTGEVSSCSNHVLSLKTREGYMHVNVEKIISIKEAHFQH
ncbi:MAG: MM0924 family protein [Candidatus Woesearchaeota archaeon]